MLSISEIRDNCYSTTYSKGRELFNSQAFRDIEIEDVPDEYAFVMSRPLFGGTDPDERISGFVKGSGSKWYAAHVDFDPYNDTIVEYECECPAYNNYYGMCKHCVALALEFREEQKRQRWGITGKPDGFSDDEDDSEDDEYGAETKAGSTSAKANKGGRTGSKKIKMKRNTSPALKTMLTQFGQKGKGYIYNEYFHNVDFVPEFTSGYNGELVVEFKIGAKKKYVVKNIVSVIHAVDTVSDFSYGKNLSFIHDRTAFSEDGLFWIDTMRDVIKALYNVESLETYSQAYYNNTFRQISLRAYGTQKCLQAYIGKVISIGTQDFEVKDENPRLELKVENHNNEGANISVESAKAYIGNQYTYVVKDNGIYQCDSEYCENALPVLNAAQALRTGRDYPVQTLYLNKEDYRLFCKNLLPMLENYFDIQITDVDFEEFMPDEIEMHVYLNMTDDDFWRIEARCEAVIGQTTMDIFNDVNVAAEDRDMAAEYEIRQILGRYFSQEVEKNRVCLYCSDEEAILGLVHDGIGALQEHAEVFVDEKIRRIQLKPAPKVTIGVGIKSELLEMDIHNDLMQPDEIINVLSAYKKKKKYFRLKNGDIIRLEDSGLQLLSELTDGLQLKNSQISQGKISVPKFRVNYIDDVIRRLTGDADLHRDLGFRKMVRDMREYSDSEFDIPDSVQAKLRKYQKEGFRWIATLAAYGLGGILADDMGLGKTLQMLTFLALTKKRTLIVCPASLVYNWESEVHKFTPGLKAVAVTGTAAVRQSLLDENTDADIMITSYDLLKRDVESYSALKFDCMVIDEAQYIKNAGTQAAKAVKQIPAGVRFALTGTPIENRLSDLWSIFDFIMPGYMYTYTRFREELEQPIVNSNDEAATARLKSMVSPFILRRKKQDVLKDLPDKLEETIYTRMTDEQEKIYKALASRLAMELAQTSDENYQSEKIKFLAELTRLRQICCAPDLCYEDYDGGSGKMDACMDLIESAIAGGHRLLVFSQFTQMLEKLISAYKDKGDYLYLSGKSSKEQRRQMVDTFQKGEIPVFFISLKAGGTGLNLTAADMVIHYDPWWNVAAQNQATDRTHRIGQKNVVTVMKLVMKNTIEEKIIKLQEEKARLAENIIEGKGASDSRISRDELLELLK